MRDIGSANVQGTLYDLLSPRVVGDYIENIGAACQNPDGYAANKIFVAYDSSMNQHLYKTTAQITQGTQITSSNCEQTSLSELLSGSGSSSSLEDLSDTDISSKTAGDIVEYNNSTGKWENTQKLVNLEKSIAPVEDGATLSQAYAIGEKFIRGGVRYKAKTDLASGTQFSSLIINTNYEAADDVSSEIQTLTNNLDNEISARAKLGAHNLLNIKISNPTVVTATVNENGITFSNFTPPYDNECYINGTSKGTLFKAGTYTIYNNQTGLSLPLYVKNKTANTAIGTVQPNESLTFTISSDSLLAFNYWFVTTGTYTGNIKPLLVLASDADTEWTPYVPTNAELLSADTNAVLGAHNWLPLILSRIKALNTTGTWNNNVYSINNLTITFNDDLSIFVSGTPSANTELQLSDMFSLPAGVDFVMEGTPASGGVNKYWWYLKNRTPSDTSVKNMNPTESGNVLHFTADATNHYYRAQLYIWASQAINETFYPLICLASDPSTAYAPYAMTNRELTEYTSDVSSDSYTKDGILVRVYRCGRQVMFLLGGTATADIAAATVLCTLDSKFAPFETANSIAIKGANKTPTKLNIATNGQVYFDDAIANGEGPRLTSLCYIAKNP